VAGFEAPRDMTASSLHHARQPVVMAGKNRQAIEFLSFIGCFFAVWSLRATLLYSIDESFVSDTHRVIYSSIVKTVLWVAPALWFAYWLRESPALSYLGISVFPSARQWSWSLSVTGIFLGIVLSLEIVFGGKRFQ
jgi:hypothetical protein